MADNALFPDEENRLSEDPNDPVVVYMRGRSVLRQQQQGEVGATLNSVRDIPAAQAAKNAELERTLQLPAGVLSRDPDEARNAETGLRSRQLLSAAPILSTKLVKDPVFAATAQDDIDPLAHTENVLKAPRGQAPTIANTLQGLWNALPSYGERVRQGVRYGFADLVNAESMREDAARKIAAQNAKDVAEGPDFEHWLPREIFQGAQSTIQMAPLIAAALGGVGKAPVLGLMGLSTALPDYAKFRERGADKGLAATGALGTGLIEAVTELPFLGSVIQAFGAKNAGKQMLKAYFQDALGEQFATLGQDAIDTAIANPDKTWKQYLEERPERARATLIASLVMSGTMQGAHQIAQRAMADSQAAQTALQNQEVYGLLGKAKEAIKNAHRSPAFQEFVDEAAQEGPIQNVYVEANTLIEALAQSKADPTAIEAALPGFTARVQEAAQSNADVALTIGEFTAHFSGTPLEQALVPHLKTEEGGMTQVQAEAYLQSQQADLTKAAEKLLEDTVANRDLLISAGKVEENIFNQLAEANRFTPEVNRAYAAMTRDFYTVTAARVGTTPEKLFEKYPIRITAAPIVEGAPQLAAVDQALDIRVPQDAAAKRTAAVEGVLADTPPLLIGLDALREAPVVLEKQVALVTTYPNFKPDRTVRTVAQKAERFINDLADNLRWLHDQIPPSIRERSKRWYDGANAIATRWSEKYALELRQVSGVIAVLSPQKDWFTNVSLAERVLDIYKNKQNFTWTTEMSRWADKFDAPEMFDPLKGKKLSEVVGSYEKSLWIRAYDEAHNPTDFQIVDPEGNFVGWQLNTNGTRARKAWGSYSTIAKAVSIIEDGSLVNIHRMLVSAHKVRSFYANIVDPNNPLGFTTIDTHANAAALLRPLSGNSPEVAASLGGGPSSNRHGIMGTYALYHEAYARAAKELGILPRELQSITWEAVRGLFTDTFKRSEGAKAVEKLWADYRKGRIKLDEVRANILKVAGGINPPDWAGSDRGDAATEWASSYTGELAQTGVSGGTGAESLADRDGTSSDRSNPEHLVNVGLDIPDGGTLTESDVRVAFAQLGIPMQRTAIHQSDTESTLVVELDRALLPAEGQRLAELLKQEAIAEKHGDSGTLHGPMAEKWGPFNPDFFLKLNGARLSETVPQDAGPMVTLTHFSPRAGLTELDPAKYGTGLKGAEARRKIADPDNWVDRTYYGLNVGQPGGYTPEQGVGSNQYTVQIPSSKLYDLKADPLKLRPTERTGWDDPLSVYEKRIKEAGFDGYVINDTAAVFTKQKPQDPSALEQKTETARGKLVLKPGTPPNLVLLSAADLTTFLHESGHFYLEVLNDIARQPNAPSSIRADMNILLNWFGVTGVGKEVSALEVWNLMNLNEKRVAHEQFARGFEKYLMEGNAPTPELQSIFARFRSWLISVYKFLTHPHVNVPLTDDVRAVMDRLLASEEAIKAAEEDRGYSMLFTSAEQAGMSQEEWQKYQEQGARATSEAVGRLTARSIADMQWLANAKSRKLKELQRKVAKVRAGVEAEVRAEISAKPEYVLKRFLTDGSLPEGNWNNEQRKALADIAGLKAKLDMGALKDMYGEGPAAPWRYLATNLVRTEDGMHPDVLAPIFGYDSGDAMVRALLAAENETQLVEGMTDQRMLERHGELSSPEDVMAAVNAAVANEARGKFLTTELNALRAATGKPAILAKAARLAAENLIARKVIRSLKPATFEHAATRAGRNSEQAMKKGNLVDAATEKRNQMLNHYAARAALRAKDEIEKSVEYLKKFDSNNAIEGISRDYRDQIDNLLERFQLRTVPAVARQKQLGLLAWVEDQKAKGIEPVISEELLVEANRKPYQDMTVEELRGLVDAVKNIEHLGRLKNKLLKAKDQREFDAVVDELFTSIADNAKRTLPDRVDVDTLAEKVAGGVHEFFAIHRKFSSLAREMDGWKDGGVMWERFVRGMNEAGDAEAAANRAANDALGKLFAPLLKGGPLTAKIFIPEINMSLSKEARIAVALNWGNETNRLRIMQGDKWTQEQVDAILKTLTRTDWQFVQGVWNYIDTFWEDIKAKELRVSGVAPEKVEALPFTQTLADGGTVSLTGGYYPIKYDIRRSTRTEQQQMAEDIKQAMTGAFTRATTKRGHVKQRAEEVNRPVQKTVNTIFQHVTQVIHDLSWHEYLIDANRLLQAIDGPLRTHYGPEVARVMRDHLQAIAVGDQRAANIFERGINHIRTGATIAGLGWNVTTSLLQPLGLTQSVVRIGPKWVGKGIASWIGSASGMEGSAKWVMQQSSLMRTRGDTMQREINEIRNRVHSQTGGKLEAVQDSFFWLIGKMQLVADLPTWIGQYEKSMAAGQTHERAVALADQAVLDSQGGGQIKDLSAIQRGGPLMKLWTNFYSFFNVTYNLVAEASGRNTGPEGLQAGRLAADYLMLLVVPSVLAVLLKEALKGGGDDDPEKLLEKLAREQLNYMAGTMVGLRDVASFINAKGGYTGPAGQRFFSEFAKLGKQVEQGEIDAAALKALNNVSGIVLHYPAGAVQRFVEGVIAINEGETINPLAPVVGPPRQ